MRNAVKACVAVAMLAAIGTGPWRAQAADSGAEALRKEVAGCGWIVFSAHPKEIAGGKLIARMSQRGPLDLYVARPDGSGLRNLTNTDEYHEYGVRLSPDGRKMLYRRVTSRKSFNHDQWGQHGELVLADADGSKAEVLGKEGELPWASWGPDGKQIACLYRREGVIRIHDLASRKVVKEMPRLGVFQQLYWSSDGKRMCGTANVAGRDWNIVSIDLQTQKATLLSRVLNCTPDFFQSDPNRVIYSNRTPGITPRLGSVNEYGFTVLMQATADGASRTLVYGRLFKHVYYGFTSPDGKYVIFADDPEDNLVVGEMHVVRLADTPIVAPQPPFPELKERYPDARDGPVLDLTLPNGTALRGFEPYWTTVDFGGK